MVHNLMCFISNQNLIKLYEKYAKIQILKGKMEPVESSIRFLLRDMARYADVFSRKFVRRDRIPYKGIMVTNNKNNNVTLRHKHVSYTCRKYIKYTLAERKKAEAIIARPKSPPIEKRQTKSKKKSLKSDSDEEDIPKIISVVNGNVKRFSCIGSSTMYPIIYVEHGEMTKTRVEIDISVLQPFPLESKADILKRYPKLPPDIPPYDMYEVPEILYVTKYCHIRYIDEMCKRYWDLENRIFVFCYFN